MKVTILTYGTCGDVQPFAVLARGLQRAGPTVCCAAPQRFAGFAEQCGLSFSPLPGDPVVPQCQVILAKPRIFIG